jgi:hypothetical protein
MSHVSEVFGEYLDCCGPDTGWFGSHLVHSISHAVSKAAKGVAHGVSSAAKVVGHAAVSAEKATVKATGIPTAVHLASDIAHGKNVLASVRAAGRDMNSTLQTAAQFASVIPGIGTAAAAGLSAAAAVGRGESLKNIALSTARGTIPGGPLAVSAFDVAVGVAKGKNIVGLTVDQVRNNLPGGPAARAAFDAGLKIARGGNVLQTAVQTAQQLAPLPPGVDGEAINAAKAAINAGQLASLQSIGLSMVRKALPGDQQKSFDAAVGMVKGGASAKTLASARNVIAGTPALRAAVDGGAAIAHGAHPSQIASAIQAHSDPGAQQVLAKIATIHNAVTSQPSAPPRTLNPPGGQRSKKRRVARRLSQRGQAYVARAAARKRDTGALSSDGKTYTVESGDSAWRIAQNLTGDGNGKWKDLLVANSPPKNINDGYGKVRALKAGEKPTNAMNFSFLKTGEVLIVPQAWIDAAAAKAKAKLGIPASSPAPTPAPAPAPTISIGAPQTVTQIPVATHDDTPAPLPAPAVVSSGTPSAERDDAQAIAQAKLILAAWDASDGAAACTLTDYGMRPEDQSPIWGPRDSLALACFVTWANTHGSKLGTGGDLTQEKLDALVAWAEAKGRLTSPAAAAPPVVFNAPAAAQTPATPGVPPPAALPGPANDAPGISGSAAPAPAQAGMGGAINIPDTVISGNPKSSGDWILIAGLAGLALVASGGKKTRRRVA